MNVLTEKTWVSASIMVGAAVAAFWAGMFVAGLSGRVSSVEKDVEKDREGARVRMGVVEAKIDGIAIELSGVAASLRSGDWITAQKMRAWRRKLAHDNPTLLIPEWDE